MSTITSLSLGSAIATLVIDNWLKVARYSFSRPMPPKFEHKLRRLTERAVFNQMHRHFLQSGMHPLYQCAYR